METKTTVGYYTREDGKLCVMNFAHNVYAPSDIVGKVDKKEFFYSGDGTEEREGYRKATIAEIADLMAPPGVDIFIIDKADFPLLEDRYFRDAWEHNEGEVYINMDKAVELQKDKLRQERAPLLAALDVQFMRAVETRDIDLQDEIVAKKNALRDVTDHEELSAAADPDELKLAGIDTIETVKGGL